MASTPLAPTYPIELVRAARDADVLALHAPFPLSDIGVLLGIPQRVALVVHWHAEYPRTTLLARPLASLVQATLSRADQIVVSNGKFFGNASALASHLHKCRVIPFGIETAFWGETNDAVRAEVDSLTSAHPQLVLAVGSLVPYKGFDILVEALAKLDATAMIVGDGVLNKRLRNLALARGLKDRVIFTGLCPASDCACYCTPREYLHSPQ